MVMQQLTFHVPDNKVAFFMELAQNLGIKVDNNILTREQIDLVKIELSKITDNPADFTEWSEARKTLNLD
jgi:hypothetical protein